MKLYHADSNINRILIVRPAIEACGESLGYLPGDANDKMRPFIEPILDNLRFFISDEGYISSLLDERIISVSPMAFMRGRTYNNCVVIFDEAQNATKSQMKLFLTRLGKNCKAIVEGDVTQSDIPGGRQEDNGLYHAMKLLVRCPSVGVVKLTGKDICRSQIVADILKRYE
jgi:phosphate starvation-inducible PhoH-like protein